MAVISGVQFQGGESGVTMIDGVAVTSILASEAFVPPSDPVVVLAPMILATKDASSVVPESLPGDLKALHTRHWKIGNIQVQ